MLTTTLNDIRAHSPCRDGWTKLLANLGKTTADDEPVGFDVILSSNGLDDALWCLRALPAERYHKALVLLACGFAETALKYVPDGEDRPRLAIEAAQAWARGERSVDEVLQAADAAYVAYVAYAAYAAYVAYAADAAYVAYVAYVARAAREQQTDIFKNWIETQ